MYEPSSAKIFPSNEARAPDVSEYFDLIFAIVFGISSYVAIEKDFYFVYFWFVFRQVVDEQKNLRNGKIRCSFELEKWARRNSTLVHSSCVSLRIFYSNRYNIQWLHFPGHFKRLRRKTTIGRPRASGLGKHFSTKGCSHDCAAVDDAFWEFAQ